VVGELEIPRLKVSVIAVEGYDVGMLKLGSGHIRGTALPHNVGNIGIAAHHDSLLPLAARHSHERCNYPEDSSDLGATPAAGVRAVSA
jgi:hypothetical protein